MISILPPGKQKINIFTVQVNFLLFYCTVQEKLPLIYIGVHQPAQRIPMRIS